MNLDICVGLSLGMGIGFRGRLIRIRGLDRKYAGWWEIGEDDVKEDDWERWEILEVEIKYSLII